jgi:hypothetical protein
MGLAEKIDDLRWHVARTDHREFTIVRDYDDADHVWVVTCGFCKYERRITETEMAEAGRPDLTDRFGIGALIESIKLQVRREVPKVWDKVGTLDIGEDE